MLIVLYYEEPSSWISRAVGFITNSKITHASIIHDGVEYDTDLLRDAFGKCLTLSTDPKRNCLVYNLPDMDPSEWIKENIGRPYDFLGYFLWIFGYNPVNKMHCFDTITMCLNSLGYKPPVELMRRPTGDKVKNWLEALGFKPTLLSCARTQALYITNE